MLDAWCEDADGKRIVTQQQGQPCRACLEVGFAQDVVDPSFGIAFLNEARHAVFVAHSGPHGPSGAFAGRRAGGRGLQLRELAGLRVATTSARRWRPPHWGRRARCGRTTWPPWSSRRPYASGGAADIAPRARDPTAVTATAKALRGPTALGNDLGRFVSLTYVLAATEFKLSFFGSALGYIWGLMRPLMLFGVLYVVFTHVIKFGEGVEFYPVYLLASIVLFSYFSETTSNAVASPDQARGPAAQDVLPAHGRSRCRWHSRRPSTWG